MLQHIICLRAFLTRLNLERTYYFRKRCENLLERSDVKKVYCIFTNYSILSSAFLF